MTTHLSEIFDAVIFLHLSEFGLESVVVVAFVVVSVNLLVFVVVFVGFLMRLVFVVLMGWRRSEKTLEILLEIISEVRTFLLPRKQLALNNKEVKI